MKILSYRQLQQRLRAQDPRFEFIKTKGKGSHRTIAHPDIDGRQVRITVPVHREGADVDPNYLAMLRRRFNLPKGVID